MSNTPINNLPAATVVTGTEIVPAVQDNSTVRITLNQIKSIISAQGTVTSITAVAPLGGGTITESGSITLDAASVDNGYLAPMAPLTFKGNALASADTPQDLSSNDVLGILGLGNMPNNTLLGNITGAVANPAPITLSQYIDTAIGNTTGSVLFRGASEWQTLPAGISGQYLTTQGPSSDPLWASLPPPSTVTSVATGTGLIGGPITTSGTISIDNTGVVAGAYGASSFVPVLTINAQGQITSAINNGIDGIALTTGSISTTPFNPTDLVNKQYVDLVAAGLKFHQACNYATTAPLSASYDNGTSGVGATLIGTTATFSVDGGTPPVGNRILVHNQSNAAQNGVYTVTTTGTTAAWVLTRATDYDTSGVLPNQINQGDFIFIISGDRYGSSSWVQQTPLPITVGVTDIVFVQFSSLSSYFAGTGLTLTGQTFSITNTGVSAGQYGAPSEVGTFTVNAQGQLTSATRASIAIDAAAITSGVIPVPRGGTGMSAYTSGNLLYASGATTLAALPIGSAGQVLTVTAGLPKWEDSTGGVTSFDAGTTGFQPAGTTKGAITLSGTLNVANGGTGQTSLSAFIASLGLGTMAYQNAPAVAITGGTINGTVIGGTTPAAITGTTIKSNFGMSGGADQGVFAYGTLNYTDSGIMASFASTTTGYNQLVVQNKSVNGSASANVNVANDGSARGSFGINSSIFSAAGSLGLANGVSLTSLSGDLTIGTKTANAVHFVINNGATDAMTIATDGSVSLPTAGSLTIPVGATAQRPITPLAGMMRFNSDLIVFEGYNGTGWSSVGGGVTSFSAGSTGFTPTVATTGAVQLGGVLNPASGGTGVNNGANTLTLAGNFATSGAFPITLTATASTALTLPTSGTLVTTVATQTLTNKQFTPRVNSVATGTTITPQFDTSDTYDVTGLSTSAAIAAPAGAVGTTPVNSQRLLIRIFVPASVGTAPTLSWNAAYRPIGITLPTTTTKGKWTYVGVVYNSYDSVWDMIAAGQQA